MNICVIGAGAIGGWMAAKIARTNAHRVSVLARGDTLAALRANGITLIEGDTRFSAKVLASDDASVLGEQDIVVIAVKAPALASVAMQLAPLIGRDTIIVSAMNGVPTWFFAREDRPLFGTQLSSIDADGSIAHAIEPSRVIGCVVHAACSVEAPAVIRHKIGNRLILGEARGGESQRLNEIAKLFTDASFDAIASSDIQRDIWFKLWGNMTMNPVSAITGAMGDKMLDDELVRAFCSRVMIEAQAIGAKIGIPIADTPEDRHAVTRKLGAFKTSMLQDVESGKAIELDALVNVVREIGAHVNVPTPNMDALFGLTRLLARTRGLY
ncbi:MAG: 2-dehydropantoate 2-reductase [Casimicrobium sp.]